MRKIELSCYKVTANLSYINLFYVLPAVDFVLQVKAEDMDRVGSANARIDYFFRETDVSVSAFRIEISTGRITVNDQLDRDLEASYELEVEALDRGDPYQPPGNCSVIITILDVNNKKPTFSEETPVEEINEGKKIAKKESAKRFIANSKRGRC